MGACLEKRVTSLLRWSLVLQASGFVKMLNFDLLQKVHFPIYPQLFEPRSMMPRLL